MTESAVLKYDLGDGVERRLFLGIPELRQIKKETGRGFFTLWTHMAVDVEPDEIRAVIRLALIGGGESPQEAAKIVDYYCAPPRPLKDAYLAAGAVMDAIWNGVPKDKSSGPKASEDEINDLIENTVADMAKAGMSVDMNDMSLADFLSFRKKLTEDKSKPAAPVDIWMQLHGKG